ncbi:MAG: zf-HC2 domain-containing protein [Deltaproteobacteria bacterium]|nr:zf-HC2 domain-containing protein [Deltaproteobacteria bacterium]
MSDSACERTSPELVAYLDGELADAARRPIADHLAGCPTCRRELERLTTLQGWLADLPRLEPGPAFATDFARRLAAEPTPLAARRGGARALRWIVPALAAAAVLTLALRSFTAAPPAPAAPRDRSAAAPPRDAKAAPVAVAAAPPHTSPDAGQVADVDQLRLEDLPPELREHPELFLRLPVVRRLETLEYLGSLREQREGGDGGAG